MSEDPFELNCFLNVFAQFFTCEYVPQANSAQVGACYYILIIVDKFKMFYFAVAELKLVHFFKSPDVEEHYGTFFNCAYQMPVARKFAINALLFNLTTFKIYSKKSTLLKNTNIKSFQTCQLIV